jgi:hypothetical protein
MKIERCVTHDQCTRYPELADLLGHGHEGHLILRVVTRKAITTPAALATADLHTIRGLGPRRIAYIRHRFEAHPKRTRRGER